MRVEHERTLHDWLLGILAVVVAGLLVTAITGAVRLIPVMYQTANNVEWIRSQMSNYYSTKEAVQAHAAISDRIDRNEANVHDLDQRVRHLEMEPHNGHPPRSHDE